MKKANDSIVTAICKQTTIPKGATLIRLPGTGNARPSAVAPPFIKPVLNWSTPPAANQQLLPPDEALVIVTNDLLHACMWTDKNPAAGQLFQLWLYSGSPDSSLINVTPGGRPSLDTDLFCSIPDGAGLPWHGPRLYALKHKGKYYMWCDSSATGGVAANAILMRNLTALAAGDGITWTIYRLNEGDEEQVFSARIPGPIVVNTDTNFILTGAPDWYRVEVFGDDDNVTANIIVQFRNQAQSEILVHQAMPDLSERMMPLVQSSRVLGAAVHAINLVSDQNATGSWVGDQPEGSILYTAYLRGAAGSNGFQALTRNRGNELMELKKFNPYCWVCPESERSMSYRQPFTFNASGGVTNIMNDEWTSFDYVVVYLKSGGVGAGADLSRNIQLEFFYGVEYLSEGLWSNPGVSPATEDDQDAARKVLTSMENIGHNPAFGEIMKTIGKYVRLSAPVLALLGPYGKAASVVATGVGEGLGMLGYRTKKTARQEEDEDGHHPAASRYAKTPRLARGDEVPDA